MDMDLKITISRSFARKLNLGNYQTADFWCSYSEEIMSNTPLGKQNSISEFLYKQAKKDVENSIQKFLLEQKLYDVPPKSSLEHKSDKDDAVAEAEREISAELEEDMTYGDKGLTIRTKI